MVSQQFFRDGFHDLEQEEKLALKEFIRSEANQKVWVFHLGMRSRSDTLRTIFDHYFSQIINENTKQSFSCRLGSLLRTLVSLLTPHHQSTTIFLDRTLGFVAWCKSKDPSSKLFDKGAASFECCLVVNIREVSVPPKREGEIGEPCRCLGNDITARVICGHMQLVHDHAQWP